MRPSALSPDFTVNFSLIFDAARLSGKISQFKTAAIDTLPVESVRAGSFVIVPVPGIGERPFAEIRGWVDLLLADTEGAAAQSKPILDFVAKTPETRWNNWFLRILSADAALFAGDKPMAIAKAKEAVGLRPCLADAVECLYPDYLGAEVLAWAGDENEAVGLLEKLSLNVPGIPPAMAARDPLFADPLASNARYKALKAKLEAQMAATKLE